MQEANNGVVCSRAPVQSRTQVAEQIDVRSLCRRLHSNTRELYVISIKSLRLAGRYVTRIERHRLRSCRR